MTESVGVKAPLMPGARPILGHLQFFADNPIDLMGAALARGPLMRLRLAGRDGYILHDPAAIKRMLVEQPDLYQKRTRGYAKLALLLGNGLVTSEGAFWLRQRRIAQPAFKKPRLAVFAEQMVNASEALMDRWATLPPGSEVEIDDAMNRLALRIAGETLFSTDVTGEAKHIGDAMLAVLERFTALVSLPLPWPEYWPLPANIPFWKGVRTLQSVVDQMIADRRQHGGPENDLLGLLMHATDPETGEAMTDRQLRDEALTMLLAGHETTANALTYTLMALAQHPDVQERVVAEVRSVVSGPPTFADVSKLVYTRQVFRESLRLYPPVWLIARVPVEDDVLCGHPVRKGSFVFVSPHSLHRHPEHWAEPERFDPDRFAPGQPPPDRHVYMPFSRGRRQCIGDRFAELESLLILASILRRYRLSWIDQPVEFVASVTMRLKHGLRLRLHAPGDSRAM